MVYIDDLIAEDINLYLKKHEEKEILRFITCGSVDDGKSTLIGRMLYESHMLFDDHLSSLEKDSKYMGTQENGLDFALLVDGLSAEREQGITIDVAYRFFSTDKRKYIVADTPGHEEYTRNMATGSSTAGLEATRAVISQFVNILSEGPLVDGNTQKTYTVRTDSLGTLVSGGTLQTAIRALNGGDNITANVGTATVNIMNLSDTSESIS